MTETDKSRFFYDELLATLWCLAAVALALIWEYAWFFASYGWAIDHPVAFWAVCIGTLGVFVTWMSGLVDLRCIT